jgi:hypothetical protein
VNNGWVVFCSGNRPYLSSISAKHIGQIFVGLISFEPCVITRIAIAD